MYRIAALALLWPLPALADSVGGGRVIECYCTDSTGGRVEMGETICLEVGGRVFTAQCQMSLNNPMWRELHEGCVGAKLEAPADSAPAAFAALR
ncbi:hypothetical protein [Roseivivax sediminis]|uniref:Uncharacterized protein n=1 Tax=Roseivivax sediminis TaxID=936889 RepID=A0A1I1Y4S0_9RHOB|nr:hypothetical protein [Roseivivax sediminis]SFE13988.1 hypothetical protein SAMN04515678_106265 [Roseivivax sediminis]